MTKEEFLECFEKIRENFDKFVKELEDESELIQNYMLIQSQLKEKLEYQEKELKRFEESNIVELWKKHIVENRRYGFEELAKEIEEKIEEFDEKLKESIKTKEEYRNKILASNKKGI